MSVAPVAPVVPNFITCDPYYGQGLSYQAAELAVNALDASPVLTEYKINDDAAEFHLPTEVKAGSVAIKIDYAGPFLDRKGLPIKLVPSHLRGLAAYVAENCVGVGGTGGFATVGIEPLLAYVTYPPIEIERMPYPVETLFATVSIGSALRYLPPPGSYDPTTALALRRAELDAIKPETPSAIRVKLASRATVWEHRAASMRTHMSAWWDFPFESAPNSSEAKESITVLKRDLGVRPVKRGNAQSDELNVGKIRKRRLS